MQRFTLSLTADELNYLGQVLQERPFKEVAGLLGSINQQIAMQRAVKAPTPALDPKDEVTPPQAPAPSVA
jgi:hypothetical protein